MINLLGEHQLPHFFVAGSIDILGGADVVFDDLGDDLVVLCLARRRISYSWRSTPICSPLGS